MPGVISAGGAGSLFNERDDDPRAVKPLRRKKGRRRRKKGSNGVSGNGNAAQPGAGGVSLIGRGFLEDPGGSASDDDAPGGLLNAEIDCLGPTATASPRGDQEIVPQDEDQGSAQAWSSPGDVPLRERMRQAADGEGGASPMEMAIEEALTISFDDSPPPPPEGRSLMQDMQDDSNNSTKPPSEPQDSPGSIMLLFCFCGIMASFCAYGVLLEYATSAGRTLHELSFLFVTSLLYTATALLGRTVRGESPNTAIPPYEFGLLATTSMGSTFCSVRSLRYVIYPIQILAKSCKPIPVMLFGVIFGQRYPRRKYVNVALIVLGVAMFMGGGSGAKAKNADSSVAGLALLFLSLCFDGGTGAYEDKLMTKTKISPFDLMFNIQLGKSIIAGACLIVFNQTGAFVEMVNEMGFLLVALGLTGAMGQVFIFVTISKFGALTTSIIGLARKVTTLCASIYIYGHSVGAVQGVGLVTCVSAMTMNFWGKKGTPKHNGGGSERREQVDELLEENLRLLDVDAPENDEVKDGAVPDAVNDDSKAMKGRQQEIELV